MGLRGFHIFFISVASLFCFGTAAIFLRQRLLTGDFIFLVGIALASLAGLALLFYALWFAHKSRPQGSTRNS